jgi:CSLREA domain-containing protein
VIRTGEKLSVWRANSAQPEEIVTGLRAASVTAGRFVFDRSGRTQLAVLASDDSVHFFVGRDYDPLPFTENEIREKRIHRSSPTRGVAAAPFEHALLWKEVDEIAGAADGGGTRLMMKTRISNNGADDVMILTHGRLAVLGHPDGAQSLRMRRTESIENPVLALAARVNVDGRPGVIYFSKGSVEPKVMMPLPDPVFNVNTTADGVHPGACAAATANQCTLREAILEANGDTIMVPAGTYTLTLPRVNGDNTGQHGALYINHSVTIVGAGQSSTFIQAGTVGVNDGTPNGVDLVMAVNEDINPLTNATASISGVTIRFGNNRGAVGVDGDGGCMEFDTGTSGTATLTLTNVTLTDCFTGNGNGGALASFNFLLPGTGMPTISNSILQKNSVSEQSAGSAGGGGAMWVSDLSRALISNTQIINNKATQVNGLGRGTGGGLLLFSAGPGSRQTVVHSTTISGNQASGEGGGIWTSSNLLIDQLSVISNNSAGANGGGAQEGGGLYSDAETPDTVTLNNVTITGNSSTGNGGGIAVGEISEPHSLSMSFSRIAQNTSSANASSDNLENVHSTVTATDNWWGTNSPSGTILNLNGGTTSFTPFLKLTNTPNPTSVTIGTSTSTLTASFLTDSAGSAVSVSNLGVLSGVPVTFNNALHGTLSGAQTAIQSTGTATATFTGSTVGLGHADAVIDGFTLTSGNIAVNAPTTTTASAQNAVFSESNQSVSLSAALTSTGGTVNGGTVTFSVFSGATQIGGSVTSSAVSSGSAGATFTLPANTGVGTYSIHANYSGTTTGTGDFLSSSDNTQNLTVTTASTTTSASNATATFSTLDQAVTLSATVTSAAGTVGAGTVTFAVFNSGTQIGTSAVSGTVAAGSASASFTLPGGTGAGTYTIHATYNPGTNFVTSSDNTHSLVVSASTTTSASNANVMFSSANQTISLSASITSAGGTVNGGTVTFGVFNAATQIGASVVSSTVASGLASANFTLPGGTALGTYSIHATYSGSGNFLGSSDTSHSLSVNPTNTTTTAANASSPFSASDQVITLSASVTSSGGTVGAGTVTFSVFNGGTQIGVAATSGTVSAGAASANFTIPGGTPANTYPIHAVYNAGGNFATSSDNTHMLSVGKIAPVITWNNPADIAFGSVLTSTQLNATANTPGTFVYTPPAGTVLSTGSGQILSVQFTPTDTTDFASASKSAPINVVVSVGPPTLVMTRTLTRDPNSSEVVVTINIANSGGSTATAVQTNVAKIGSTPTTTALPLALPDIPAGGSSTGTLRFPSSVGTPGAAAVLSITGTDSAGTLGGSSRVTLP